MISVLFFWFTLLSINIADAANLDTSKITKDEEHHLVIPLFESATKKYVFDHQILDKVIHQQIDHNSIFGLEYTGHNIARYVKVAFSQNFIHNQ